MKTENNNNEGLGKKIKTRIEEWRNSVLPIKENDTKIVKLGKNVGFASFLILMSVVTLVLTIVISVVL